MQQQTNWCVVKDKRGDVDVLPEAMLNHLEIEKVLIEGLSLKIANAFENGYLACLREVKASLEQSISAEVNQ